MTPYELRFEIFKQAQNLADQEFHVKYGTADRWNDEVDKNGGIRVEYPEYPMFHYIETLAERINDFVSGK